MIDTVVAMATIAVLATSGMLAASSMGAAFRLAATARVLAQTMRETRARAMAEGTPLDVRFDATTRTWTIHAPDGTIRRSEPLPPPVRFLGLPASGRIRFDSAGTAENGTIALAAGTATRRIVVNQRGRVRLA
jgi:Tfp pilus assembly protein FimT